MTQIVRQRIFDVTKMFYEDITAFMELIQKQRFDETEKEMKHKRREVAQARKRIAELDRIFKRIYEDDINGKRFQKVDIVFNFVGKIHFPTEPQTERKETNKQEKTA